MITEAKICFRLVSNNKTNTKITTDKFGLLFFQSVRLLMSVWHFESMFWMPFSMAQMNAQKPAKMPQHFHLELLFYFLKVWPIGSIFTFTFAHSISLYRHMFNHTLKWSWCFVVPSSKCGPQDIVKKEVESHIILNHLFPEEVAGTCTHLMERGHLLHFCTDLFYYLN